MKRYEDEKSTIIRESIGEAILSILSTQDFGEISVCDICTRAGVGRTTYYRYYGNKSGKEDAVYYWLINRWEAYTGCQTLSLAQTDQAFFSFIFSIKTELLLLKKNHLLHILDSFILSVYGPQDDSFENIGFYYVKYSGAGLWMGLLRAIIYRDFSDSEAEVKERFQEALTALITTQAP